jgi:hypothetical protein
MIFEISDLKGEGLPLRLSLSGPSGPPPPCERRRKGLGAT